MRRLRIFLVEIVAVPALLGWLFVKFPESLDSVIPWIALAVLWHLTWEFVLDPLRSRAISFANRMGRMAWLIAFCVGGLVSLAYFYSIKVGIADLGKQHAAAIESGSRPRELGQEEGHETPSPKVDAYIQPGSSNPYPPQTILGGIVWDDKYVDVRLDIGVGAVAIQNLDFEVALDTSIAGIGQISQFAGVTSFPDGRQMPSVSLEGTDDKGEPITVPLVPTQGLAQIAPRYRVHCNALYSNTALHLVIASVALNQATQGRLPEQLFAPKRSPHLIKLKGTFEAASPIEFQRTFDNPESERPTRLPAQTVHTPKPITHVPQPPSENLTTITVEARMTCTIKEGEELPPSTQDIIGGFGTGQLVGSAGTVELSRTNPVEFRKQRNNEMIVVNHFYVANSESLIGTPIFRLMNYDKVIVPITVLGSGRVLDQIRLVEITMTINNKYTWYYPYKLGPVSFQDGGPTVSIPLAGIENVLK